MASSLKKITDTVICQLSHWKNRKQFQKLRSNSGNYSLSGFDRLNCIYVHIPKAAGISINEALFGNYGGGHKTVYMYKRIFGPVTYRKYFKFTFVRNPYSRLLSAYQFLKKGGFNKHNQKWATDNLAHFSTFDNFIKDWLTEESMWDYYHFKPQYSFVCDLDLQPEVDFIGKVESMNRDFDIVCRQLNISNTLNVLNKSETEHYNWQEYYSSYSLDKVKELYRHDFEIFNY